MNETNVVQAVSTVEQPVKDATVHQGRWGFYPCDYDTYRKLKRLNFLAIACHARTCEHARWERKEPQNRVWVSRPAKGTPGRRAATVVLGPKQEPVKGPIKDWGIITGDYRKARYPKPDAASVEPLTLLQFQIDTLLQIAEDWYAQHGKSQRPVS